MGGTKKPARNKAVKKKAAVKKAVKKKAAVKKAVKKKAAVKKAAPKKAPAKKAAPKKTAVEKVSAKKPAPRKAAPLRATAATKPRPAGNTTRSAKLDAERRAAAVRAQLSKARIGTFEDLVEPCEPETRTTANQLRSLVLELIPDARETVYLRWRIAIYKRSTEICGIQPAGDRCNFYLTKGAYLQDPQGILEGSGKAIRHVKVRSVLGMAAEGLRDLLKQAMALPTP